MTIYCVFYTDDHTAFLECDDDDDEAEVDSY